MLEGVCVGGSLEVLIKINFTTILPFICIEM